jgi:hypothetical protein
MMPPAMPAAEDRKIREIPVERLLLDPLNPRLPEGLVGRKRGASAQAVLLDYFSTHGVLDELAASFVDNGFFATEPLIVTPEGAPVGSFVVLEGNRRLAALQILLFGTSEQRSLVGSAPTAARRRSLLSVPCIEVEARAAATAMIGFRHIGGLKFWESDAKARWIRSHVDSAWASSSDPFKHVARQVGLSVAAVRQSYLAWAVVDHARTEFGYDVSHLISEDRFGVWLRAVESPKIRGYIGIGDLREYGEMVAAIPKLRKGVVLEVLGDIAPPPGEKTVVGDSRNITRYADVLADVDARKVLRNGGDLAEAHERLAPVSLLARVQRSTALIRRIRDELEKRDGLDPELREALRELRNVVKTLSV